MSRVLITAFGKYGSWKTNSSWLALIELTKSLPSRPQVTTRLYPVELAGMRQKLEHDLRNGYDCALHLGQAPGAGSIQLETIGLNVGGNSSQHPDEFQPLVGDGPIAFRSELPLARWAAVLRQAGIPAHVSYHAGTYLCNATLYMSHYLSQQHGKETRATFMHLPLATSQVLAEENDLPSLSSTMAAEAIRLILREINDDAA
jgi:pyroglutamyl-peptidase